MSWIDDMFTEDERALRGTVVVKHGGPGPHPSGSPQSAHAGGRGAPRALGRLAPGAAQARWALHNKMIRNGSGGSSRSRAKHAVSMDLAEHAVEHAGLTEAEIDEMTYTGANEPAFYTNPVILAAVSRLNQHGMVESDSYLHKVLADEGLLAEGTSLGQDALGLSRNGLLRLAVYEQASNFLERWAHTALDHDEKARWTQVIADEMFPGKHEAFERYVTEMNEERNVSVFPDHPNVPALDRKLRTAFLSRTYDQTQALLAEIPGTHVHLMRGLRHLEGQGGMTPVMANPLSSWTTDESVAKDFSMGSDNPRYSHGYILEAAIPKSWIVSTPLTGLGALHETEVIVNIPDGTEVLWKSQRYA